MPEDDNKDRMIYLDNKIDNKLNNNIQKLYFKLIYFFSQNDSFSKYTMFLCDKLWTRRGDWFIAKENLNLQCKPLRVSGL